MRGKKTILTLGMEIILSRCSYIVCNDLLYAYVCYNFKKKTTRYNYVNVYHKDENLQHCIKHVLRFTTR